MAQQTGNLLQPSGAAASFERRNRFTAQELLLQEFPPLTYVIPGIIPEGLTLLVGPPKVGKSWLVLDVAAAIACGRPALGVIPIERPRPVLYYALEDGARRLKSRLISIGATELTERFEMAINVVSGDVLGEIREWVEAHSGEGPVVILDTLGKVMPPTAKGETDYQRDYRVGGGFKAILADSPGASIILVHHTRKQDSDDFIDSVSGTQGLAGSADSIVVLKRSRAGSAGSLSVASRDAAEGSYAATFENLRWTLKGGSLGEASGALQVQKSTEQLDQKMTELVLFVNGNHAGVRAADVVKNLGMEEKTASTYLLRAHSAGRIGKRSRGLYAPVGTVESVGNESVSNLIATDPTLPTHVSIGGIAEWSAESSPLQLVSAGGQQ